MKLHYLTVGLTVLGVGTWLGLAGPMTPVTAQQRERAAERRGDRLESRADAQEEGVEVLTRGPVHEAFAETVTFDPEPGIVVTKEPPRPIEELPPEQKPQGANVEWIPGYWGWDDDRDDFIWISGVWRSVPPGRQWVVGYWARTSDGFQWISGYWADADADEVEYLPEPPETVESGPNVEAASADQIWVPGTWVWHQSRYAWRPGYWARVEPNWLWVPAYYVWSPRGYVFVEGYWDYPVVRRGVLFAPVYFDEPVYARAGFYYSPAIVISIGLFTDHLFLRPHYHHYYFGDYYAASYYDAGFYPWFSFHDSHYGYDPIYAHHRWEHRSDREWERRVEADFRHRRDHEDARPPRTFAAMKQTKSQDKSVIVATSLDELAKSKDSSVRFESLDESKRKEIGKRGQEVHKLREDRQKLEAKEAAKPAEKPGAKPVEKPVEKATKPTEKSSEKPEPGRAKLPRSPVTSKPADKLGKDNAPPKAHEAPKPDMKVEPKPRKAEDKPKPPREDVKEKPKGKPENKPQDESKSKPKAESKETPKGEPKEKPKSEAKDKPKDKDKDKPKN
jgi:WXXGXW repeat (2 copies)